MKTWTLARLLVITAVLFSAAAAFAGTKLSVNLNQAVTVNNQSLAAGSYKLEWEGQGPAVEVSILKDNNVVAKVPAKVVGVKQPFPATLVSTKTNSDGSYTLNQVQPRDKKFALDFTGGNLPTEASNK